ncbi:MAG: FprA family A-type flavoprotein [Clostridia bacterium]|nr:FprA family A-type flavoprotein [Clostridia bacterium]
MEIRPGIYSVGVADSDIRVFHGYLTPIGTTYNAYLVVDDRVTLVDFVKKQFAAGFLANIRAVLGERAVDNIICNHVEPDHSGAIAEVLEAYPQATVYGTANAQKGLTAYYPNVRYEYCTIKAGDTLCTGKHTFSFLPLPMIHWPDSMATYLATERILFSNDAFGQHIGTGQTWDEQLNTEFLLERAADYYANIVLLYGNQVCRALEAVSTLDVAMICPSHGVILQKNIGDIVGKYKMWCANQTVEKAVIIYDTMWGTTGKLAQQLYDEYTEKGITAELLDLSQTHHSTAMAKLLEAQYICVGSPTLNNQMMPSVSGFLTYMCGLKPKNRTGRAFGSYGWSGESVVQINKQLADCGFDMLPPVKAQWNV